MTFISFAQQFHDLIAGLVSSPHMHAKWLNTLSFLENCGARKIAACEHPTLVKEEMLKHAAEEFRHAHYLKKQIAKIDAESIENYSISNLLGGTATLHYLSSLDLFTCRYLHERGLSRKEIRESAYLLVTYAIELRAQELYPIYEKILRMNKSKVRVNSILLEEKEHLQEMEKGLGLLQGGFEHAERVCSYESELCLKWIESVV